MTLGEKIKKLRKARKWSQAELATKIEVHGTHVSRLETSRYTPSLDLLMKLAEVFEVSTDYLLYEAIEDEGALQLGDKNLYEKMKLIEGLDDEDQNVILGVIDAFLTKRKVWDALGRQVSPV